jgi:hypothetical protein
MIERFRISKVDELSEVTHVEILPVKPGPVYVELFVQLLTMYKGHGCDNPGSPEGKSPEH